MKVVIDFISWLSHFQFVVRPNPKEQKANNAGTKGELKCDHRTNTARTKEELRFELRCELRVHCEPELNNQPPNPEIMLTKEFSRLLYLPITTAPS